MLACLFCSIPPSRPGVFEGFTVKVERLKCQFRCLGVDLRGNGGDTPSGTGPNVVHFADDICRVIQALDLKGAYAFGHSVGGTSALRAQAAQPDCLSAIYCYEPIIFNPKSPEPGHGVLLGSEELARVARKRRRQFPSRGEAGAKYARRPPFDAFSPVSLQAYLTHGFKDVPGGVGLRCDPADEADTYVTLNGSMPQFWPEVLRASCPVAIIAGGCSPNNAQEIIAGILEETAAQLPTAVFQRLDGLFHMGPFEAPERVAAAILAHHARFANCAAEPAAVSRL